MELRIAFREVEPPSGWASDESTGTRLPFGGWLELIRSIEGLLEALGQRNDAEDVETGSVWTELQPSTQAMCGRDAP